MAGPVRFRQIEQVVSKNPEKLTAAADDYLNAMNEMYRANTRAREGGRAFTLYWARRFEFALEYMSFAQAVQKASAAERRKTQRHRLRSWRKESSRSTMASTRWRRWPAATVTAA